jgi:hypothetical protein
LSELGPDALRIRYSALQIERTNGFNRNNTLKKGEYLEDIQKGEKVEGAVKSTIIVDSIKMNLREIGWGETNKTDLTQDGDKYRALVNTSTKLWVP